MDVRLPDGTIVTNVPEGTTQSELVQRLRRARASDPTEGMSWVDKALAGFGKAIVDTGRGLGQLVGAVDQKDIDEAKRLDAPLVRSGGGIVGNVAGNLATMIGPAAALGAAGKAAHLPTAVNAARAFMAPKTALGGAGIGAALSGIQPVASDESRGLNMALGGVVGGAGTAAANALARRLGPKAATLTPEQADLIRRAQALGYELKPSEITGKRWQQNLEAAMAQAPTTSGRMQDIAARNQAVTGRLAEEALSRAGGQIDQPSAASAALEGWQEGLANEGDRLGAAYRSLLAGAEVNLEQARPALQELVETQKQLPATSQSGNAMAALSDLLGSQGYQKAAKTYVRPNVDPYKDDIITAIRKLGGITPTDEAVGSLAKGMPFAPDPRLGPVWANPRTAASTSNVRVSGHSLDDMAGQLYQAGYLKARDPNELMDKIADGHMGIGQHFSEYYSPKVDDPLATAIEGLTAKLGEKGRPMPRAGYIRDNPTIPGEVAQNLRSDYSLASRTEQVGRDRRLFAGMKQAIDGAIEESLPEAQRRQFQSINKRYGIYAGLESIPADKQQAFLNRLYRGSDSPDEFYTFIGLAPEGKFKDVARGFVSKMIEGAAENGNVSAVKLGAAVNKANPEALRVFGGSAADLMRDVGNIGRNVVREQTPNSGTGQRLMYQGLLTGAGLGIGGYLGSEGGSPGAVAGSAIGAFLMPKAIQSAYLSKALRPMLTSGAAGRSGLLGTKELEYLLPLLSRAPLAGLLGLSE